MGSLIKAKNVRTDRHTFKLLICKQSEPESKPESEPESEP